MYPSCGFITFCVRSLTYCLSHILTNLRSLELLSLTYQLEILIFQAMQLREFGWKDSLRVRIAPDRKSFGVQYWVSVSFPSVLAVTDIIPA